MQKFYGYLKHLFMFCFVKHQNETDVTKDILKPVLLVSLTYL